MPGAVVHSLAPRAGSAAHRQVLLRGSTCRQMAPRQRSLAIVLAVLLAREGDCADAGLANVDLDQDELADPDHAENLALQTEMLDYYCAQYQASSICHKLEHERELHGGVADLLPVQHLQEAEDDEVHRVWCADGAPGHVGNPKLCDEHEQRQAARVRDRILKEQVRRQPVA